MYGIQFRIQSYVLDICIQYRWGTYSARVNVCKRVKAEQKKWENHLLDELMLKDQEKNSDTFFRASHL